MKTVYSGESQSPLHTFPKAVCQSESRIVPNFQRYSDRHYSHFGRRIIGGDGTNQAELVRTRPDGISMKVTVGSSPLTASDRINMYNEAHYHPAVIG